MGEHPAQVEGLLLPALLLLLLERPSHGYELIERMENLGVAERDPSMIYRGLYQLESWGLVSSSWDTAADYGRPRRVYKPTAEGEKVMSGWSQEVERQKGQLEDFLAIYQRLRQNKNAENHQGE